MNAQACVCWHLYQESATTVLEPNSACCLNLYVKFYWNAVNQFIYIFSLKIFFHLFLLVGG